MWAKQDCPRKELDNDSAEDSVLAETIVLPKHPFLENPLSSEEDCGNKMFEIWKQLPTPQKLRTYFIFSEVQFKSGGEGYVL